MGNSMENKMTTLKKILDEGYKKVDMNLRHFEIYECGTKRLLYNVKEKSIDIIYDTKNVFKGTRGVTFPEK